MNIKLLRDALSLSQNRLAIQLGVTQQTVANWEKGKTLPESARLLICQQFHVRREWLESGEGAMFEEPKHVDTDRDAQRRFVREAFERLTDEQQDIILEALRELKAKVDGSRTQTNNGTISGDMVQN